MVIHQQKLRWHHLNIIDQDQCLFCGWGSSTKGFIYSKIKEAPVEITPEDISEIFFDLYTVTDTGEEIVLTKKDDIE